jgi:hypothetical protein
MPGSSEMEIMDPILITLDADAIGEELQVGRIGGWDLFRSAFEIVRDSIAAKAVYTLQYVEARSDDGVVIDGIFFKSRILRKNLEHIGRVFPYVTTIGTALEESADQVQDLLVKYYLDIIGNIALVQARKHLEETLRSRFALDGLSFMSPGSLKDWPIEQQRPLFSSFDGIEHAIGVRLTENCLMIPKKSVSGIYFPTETTFYSCQLCPRGKCVGRKAAYSQELAMKYGISKKKEEA